MRVTLALLLMVSLVACAGGDNDDAATATVRPATPTATVAASPTSTTAPSTSSPEVDVTDRPGGGIGQQSTAETGDATPTRRPVTVVTTPRPIAKTPTPVFSFPTATATAPENDDGLTIVVDDLFDDPASTTFFTGETEYGTIATIENGRYNLAVPEASWQFMVSLDSSDLGNGAILVEAGMNGDGAVGVVGRSAANDDGTWTFYICWLATDGRSGCHVSISGEWVSLFVADAGMVPILDLNTLYLSVVGDLVAFSVNDTPVGSINDGTAALGTWGVYAESFTGTSVGWFERVTIARFDE